MNDMYNGDEVDGVDYENEQMFSEEVIGEDHDLFLVDCLLREAYQK